MNDDIEKPEDQDPPPAADGDTITPAKVESDAERGLPLPDDVVNLVPALLEAAAQEGGEKYKKFLDETLPTQVLDDVDEGLKSREGWMDARRERMKLWLGALEEKAEPWKNCANMHVPLVASRCLRLQARTFAEIFRSGEPILTAQANSKTSEEKAETITKHMNWNLRKNVPAFPRHIQRGLHEFFRDGDCVFHSHRDLKRGVNKHEHLGPEEFVYPYVLKTVEPDMSDVPWKCKILHLRKRDLLALAADGYYSQEQVDKVVANKGTYEDDVDHPIKDEANKYEGVDRMEATRDAPYTALEYYGWTTLPGQDDEIPIRAVVEKKTRTVLGLFSRYYDDPQDRARFARETAEQDQYQQELDMFSQAMQGEADLLQSIQARHAAAPDDPFIADEARATIEQVQRQRPAPPLKPQWMDAKGSPPKPCAQKIHEPFVHAVCIENPDGSYGLGIGMLIEPHNRAANIMLNQFIDRGTLANEGGIKLIHQACKLPPGVTSIDPGKWTVVDGPMDILQRGVFQLPVPPADPSLMNGVNMQSTAADSVSSAPDVLSGEKEGDETFRGQATRVEQAVKQLTVVAGNFMLAMTQIAKNDALLNYWFLPTKQQLDVPDPVTNKMGTITIGRDLYRDDIDIMFTADLTFTSRAAKIAEKDDILGLLTKGIPPQLATLVLNPTVYSAAIRDCLIARGAHDIAAMLPNEQEVQSRIQQQQQAKMTAGAPGGPPGAPGAGSPQPPHPSVPTGNQTNTPGTVPPQSHVLHGIPAQAAPSGPH